jgi:hypothetical protein
VSELGFFLLVFGVQYTCDDQRGKEVCDPIATSRRDITRGGEEPVLAEERGSCETRSGVATSALARRAAHPLTNHDIAP